MANLRYIRQYTNIHCDDDEATNNNDNNGDDDDKALYLSKKSAK